MTTISRRKLFGFGAVAGLGLAACGPQPIERRMGDLADLDKGHFDGEVGTRFQVVSGEALFTELALISVKDLSQSAPAGGVKMRGELFNAVFIGPADRPFPQAVYRLEHERLGGMSILLVPTGANAQGCTYEALFNRQVPA